MKGNAAKISIDPQFKRSAGVAVAGSDTATGDILAAAYSYPAESVIRALEVRPEHGLTTAEAGRRLESEGANVLFPTPKRSVIKLLLDQFSSIIIWLLATAAVIALLSGKLLEAGAIFVVLLLNALIGFAIEWQAGEALEALRKATKTKTRVRRDGYEQIIETEKLLAGDLLVLTSGDRVPADARIYEAADLQVDESTLTGESLAVEKTCAAVVARAPLAERQSMLYLGTSIVRGRAQAIVTATGTASELGRIGKLLAETNTEKTPLERRLADLGAKLVYIVLGIALIVFFAGYLRGENLWLMLEVSISLAVAAVPEGLPAVTTLVLAFGVLRMARRNAIVRRLTAVETLGATTVICTDKTGTLTENRMAVREYRLADEQRFEHKAGALQDNPALQRLLKVSVLCSEAAFRQDGEADQQAIGDPTETALLVAADALGFQISSARRSFEKIAEQPFHSATKKMVVVMREANGRQTAMMKGAPAVVLARCTDFVDKKGRLRPLDEELRRKFLAVNEEMAGRSLRVLAFAEKRVPDTDPAHLENGYTFLGLAGMNDPLRREAFESVAEARRAGIRVIMLTGDQTVTAKAIAKELNLSEGEDIFALHSQDLANVSSEKLAELAKKAHVFARVTPEDKLRIVKALQKSGEIVAVTGDGVNDAPALKKADIGVAMGERGTEVAKEAADIVLTDDNFTTIIRAVEAGRTIYANILRFVHVMFSKNLGEVFVIFMAMILNLALPLLPLQILWVNLVMDVFPGLALALEPPTPETTHRAPLLPQDSLLSRRFLFLIFWQGVMLAVIIVAAYIWAIGRYGDGAHARTIALMVLIGGQIGHLFNCRSRCRSAFDGFWRNPFVFMAVGIVVSLQLLAVYFTPLATILEIVIPTAVDWFIIGLSTILPIVVVEITKYFSRRTRGVRVL